MDVRTEAERMNIATVRCNIPLKGKYIHTATSSCGLLIRYSQTDSMAEEIHTRLDRIPFQTSAQVNLASTDLHSFSHIDAEWIRMNYLITVHLNSLNYYS